MVSVKEEQEFSVVPEKKFSEVKCWFEEHFFRTNQRDYLSRSPFVILFGSTGCGKTSILERIARELKLSIKEYSETTDTSFIQSELRDISLDRENSYNNTLRIDKRRSLIFESFVINNVRYETLYSDHSKVKEKEEDDDDDDDDAAAEFDDDDDFVVPPSLSQTVPKPPPRGVIIHIESPLSFGRTTPIFIQCLRRLRKTIKEISRQTPRRVAIVFEATNGNEDIMSLPSNVRQSLDIESFRINPVTRINMKKFIELELSNYNYHYYTKDILDQLIDDCDGDVGACKNTIRLLCHQKHSSAINGGIYKPNTTPTQLSKRQKIDHGREKRLVLQPKLMRDMSKGSGFFHILGKIFYQKRYYPQFNSATTKLPRRSIDRPYETQNSTEYLVDQIDSESKKLIAWLHQNYPKFCAPNDMEKVALFLENLSFVDTMSLDSTQSTQYYENHKFIDQLQKHVAIESTVFSLYKDESQTTKKSTDKKVKNSKGQDMILKASVDANISMKTETHNHFSQGFAKPTSLIISKISEVHRALLDRFSSKMTRIFGRPYEQNDLLLDYAPYTKILLDRSAFNSHQTSRPTFGDSQTPTWARPNNSYSLNGHEHLRTIIEEIQKIDDPCELNDYDQRHETLVDLIDKCDSQKVKQETSDSMDVEITNQDVLMYD